MAQAPSTPADEKVRIQKLRSLNLLDSESEERFDRLTRISKKLFDVQVSTVSLIDTNRQWFKSKCEEIGLPNETSRETSFCGHAINEYDVFVVEDALTDMRFKDNPLVTSEPNIRFYAGYPIRIGNGSALGTLCIFDNKPRKFDEEDKQFLRDLGAMAEGEIAALELATTDELTSLSNSRGFKQQANHELKVAVRSKAAISLCMIDLNKFKIINDSFGHAEGNYALLSFAEIMKSTLRDSDVYGRIGGDEFALIIPNSSDGAVSKVRERLSAALKTYNETQNRGYDINFSFGSITILADESTTLDVLLDKADKSMYQEKNKIDKV